MGGSRTRPARCDMSCRSVIGRPYGLWGWNSVTYVLTGASRSTFPCSTSCMIATSVKSFETDPTRYTVSGPANFLAALSTIPKPRDQTTC